MVNEDEVLVRRLNSAIHCEIWENGTLHFGGSVWWVREQLMHTMKNARRFRFTNIHTSLDCILSLALLHSFSIYHSIETIISEQLHQIHRWIEILLQIHITCKTLWSLLGFIHSYRLPLLRRVFVCVCAFDSPKINNIQKKIIIITKPHNERTPAASSRSLFCSQ